MANQAKNTEKSTTDAPAETAKSSAIDYATDVGTLTYARAATLFGKDRAVAVIKEVARIGGHGMLEDDDIKSPLFGGLAMPDPAKIIPVRDDEFPETMPEREFHLQAAMEEHESFKQRAVADRAKINEYLNSLKS